ncbi:MAG: hypothetical protein WCF20_13250 [Methylovirgula sp.]
MGFENLRRDRPQRRDAKLVNAVLFNTVMALLGGFAVATLVPDRRARAGEIRQVKESLKESLLGLRRIFII